MAKVFYYSKKFSEQGPAISDVAMSHLFTLSRKVEVSDKYKLGYRTYGAALTLMKNYALNNLIVNEVQKNARFGSGLTGNGTAASPLKVDVEWVNQNYVPKEVWSYTQIGDPSDFTLPIAGSYFSVSYPYTNDQLPPTAIVEGNGDLRILRHVTNGEDVRVVYSTWKNYRGTPVDSMTLTDIVYRPPGLSDDEFIRNIMPSSGTAMIGEIHNAAGFKEHAFIILNDTAIADFHKIIRLGSNLVTGLWDTPITNSIIQQLRSMTVMAAVLKGRNYVGMVLPPNFNNTGIQQQFAFAEVSTNGNVTRLKNWTATNSMGLTRTDPDYALLNQKVYSTDLADKDGVYYCGPGVTMASTATVTGTSPFQRASWVDCGDNKHLMINLYTYAQVGTSVQNAAAKAQFYYIVDLEGRTMKPEANTGFNRRPQYTVDSANRLIKTHINPDMIIYERDGHYWAQGRNFQMLPNGDRIYWVVGSTDVTYKFTLYQGGATNGLESGNDKLFAAPKTYSRTLDMLTPTPVISAFQATLLHDNVIVHNSDKIAVYSTSGSCAKLEGSDTAKTYNLYTANSFAPRVPYKGYALNNSRSSISTGITLNINSIRYKGKVYYHNAMWSPATPQTRTFAAKIDANLNAVGKYACDPAVYTALNNYINAIPNPAGFTELHGWDWLVVPPYPGIGYDYAIVKIWYSHRVPDASDPRGYRYTGTSAQFSMVPATYRVDSLGNVTLESVNLSKLQNQWFTMTPSYHIGRVESWQRGASAIDVDTDMVYVIVRGGGSSGSHYGSDHASWQCRGFTCKPDGTNVVNHSGSVNYINQPVVHEKHGLGIVSGDYGLGTFYVFVPILKPSFRADTDTNNYRVLTSARPAAGFNLTVNAPITVYVNGVVYTIPIQTRNLMDISSAYKNTTFYCYASLFNGVADLQITKTIQEETLNKIFLGTIKTSDTEITGIDCRPVTRWEVARTSVYPIGAGIPVSTGLPTDTDVRVWESREISEGTPHEYLWGSDDIIDTENERSIDDVYWSNYADGSDRVTNLGFGDDAYLIVRTTGIDGNVSVSFDRNDLDNSDFELGSIEGVIDVPIIYSAATNTGFGSVRLRTWEMSDMAFKNATWSKRTDRAIGTVYTNNTDFEIAVSIKVQCEQNVRSLALEVDGIVIDSINSFGDYWKSTLKIEHTLHAIVPAKSTYRLYNTLGTGGLVQWNELRRA